MDALQDRWVAESEEVLYPRAGFVAVGPDDIDELKRRAAVNPRGRCRICLHADAAATLHDMVIVLTRGAYDRPHRHFEKVETLIALEGEATFLQFDADGRLLARRPFSAAAAGKGARVLRTPAAEYHGLLVESEFLVFCESTMGPFDPAAGEFAPWSPSREDKAAVDRYVAVLRARATVM